ncbi:MAG: hypothetical protein LBI12_01475 [Treponema sp.]|jgi:hypothetical protein|nr:hypothetical protein [Treponema sp.]
MERKLLSFLIIFFIIFAVSCPTTGSVPANDPQTNEIPANNTQESKPPVQAAKPAPVEEAFDPATITQDYYASTMSEVQQFIEELNRVIRNRNYSAWRAALSQEYFDEISSPENLRQISELPAMTTRRIVLRSPQDYFTPVVVPSRANSRVDEIEFISLYRVKAFTTNTNRPNEEQRLRLYDLEKIDNSWKIIN